MSSEIIDSNSFSFEKYKELVNGFLSKDNRELNYQNRVIIPMLEKIFANYDSINIVDVSTQYKNWEDRDWHDRSKYAGYHTPDVLIAENWDIYNRNKDIKYRMLIEIKTPNAKNRKHAMCEVNDYLKYVPNVILTDLITWEFFTRDSEKSHSYSLEKEKSCENVCERGENNKTIYWKKREVNNPEFIVKELGFPHKRVVEPKEWEDILCKLESIIIS